MNELYVYCNTCNKKVKAVILTKHDKEYDESTKSYKRYGMVRILQPRIGFKNNCDNTSQIKALVESDFMDDNGVMI
jgi:hypothetical protein